MASSSPTFGPQWPQRNPHIVTLTRRDGLRIPVHKELLHLISMLMDLTERMGYDIKPGQTWGYANRAISGTRTPSNHSRGCAVDINAPSNPYASADWHRRNATSHPFGLPRRTDIPMKVFELWERHGFSLGVKYQTKPDPMHFEFTQSLNECRRITQRLAQSMNAAPPKPKPKPKPKPEEDDDMPKPLLLRLTAKDPAILYMSSARTVHWVKSGEALQGYKYDMQNNGLSPEVCVLSQVDEKGQMEELHDFVINLPFIGEWPTSGGKSTGVKEAWQGAWIKNDAKT